MPTDSMTAPRAVFDHETESRSARRRRAAPDWGGDDLFDHVPRRRFSHSSEAPARRGDGLDERARHRVARHADWFEDEVAAVASAPRTARPAPVAELVAAREAEYAPSGPTTPAAPNGRRTVTVTGRPGAAFAPRTSGGPARTRGPRTVEERIGTRPDQVAGWAFALGVLLILIALLV